MKIIEINLKKEYVKAVPETADDLWHLYNVILRNDTVYANTTREIKPDGKYSRPQRGERVAVFLGLRVEEIAWNKFMGKLRVHGTIFEAPEKVPTGAYHTLNIALNTPLTIVKEKWTKQQIDRLKRASCASEKPIIIVSIDDENYAIGVTAQYGVNVKIEERIKLPGKLEAEKRSGAIKKYFDQVLASLRQVRANSTQPVVIIGVGYVKNDFAHYVKNEAEDIAEAVLDVKSVNNGGAIGINEALRSGILLNAVKQLRVAEETEIVEELLKRLAKDEKRVTYGFEEVQKAAEAGATEKLVIADSLLREATDDERLRIEEVMRQVEDKRGEVIVVSTENEAGNQLLGLGGIAALLRFGIS